VTALIPTFALLSVGTVYLGTTAVYLSPWLDVFESISLVNFFFLIQAYLTEADRENNQAPLKLTGNEGHQVAEQYNSTAATASKKSPPAGVITKQASFIMLADHRTARPPDDSSIRRRGPLRCCPYRHYTSGWALLPQF